MNDIFIQDAIDLAEELFLYPDLLKVEIFSSVEGDLPKRDAPEMASIRQKLLQKIKKQKQFSKPRDNFAVIELNNSLIAGDFTIISSLSAGYKITINNNKDTIEADLDQTWHNSAKPGGESALSKR